MTTEKFVELYADLCNLMDYHIDGWPLEIPSTSDAARKASNDVMELLKKYGIDVEELTK